MNMKDIMIVCDVVMDSTDFVPEIIGSLLLIFVPVLGIMVFAIVKLAKLIKSNKINIDSIKNEQSDSATQKDDIK